jgi:hypothetical protein
MSVSHGRTKQWQVPHRPRWRQEQSTYLVQRAASVLSQSNTPVETSTNYVKDCSRHGNAARQNYKLQRIELIAIIS